METEAAGAAPAPGTDVPAAKPAAAKKRAGAGAKAKKAAEAPLADLVKEDVLPYVRDPEAVVDIDLLEVDHRVELGQIRALDKKEVERLLTAMRHNPPTARVRVTLWEKELDESGDGVTPFHTVIQCHWQDVDLSVFAHMRKEML